MVDKRPTGEPVARRPPARLVHRRQDATLEVEVRARVEAGVAQRPHRLVEDHVAVPAPMPARHAVSLEKKLTVEVVRVLEEAIDDALDGAPEAGEWQRTGRGR